MRLVVDLQAAQAGNARRGVGRYALSLVRALARLRGDHDIVVVLSGQFAATLEPLRGAFEGLLPPNSIRVWTAPGLGDPKAVAATARRRAAELLREAFLTSLQPDWVLVASLFEDTPEVVASIGRLDTGVRTAGILYDLIPLRFPSMYLRDDAARQRYATQLDTLRRADLLLAISEASGADAVRELPFDAAAVVNIAGAADPHFRPLPPAELTHSNAPQRHGLHRPFVLYTGGIDPRKNIEGLIRAWALLPIAMRRSHQLAVVCAHEPADGRRLRALAASVELAEDELVLTGYVPEDDLVVLYNLCQCFVFPSLYEGFGLPVLEAMACGCAVIASCGSSLPEVMGRTDCLFDPADDQAIADSLQRVLDDRAWRESLRAHGLARAAQFSWDDCARRAWQAMETARHRVGPSLPAPVPLDGRKPQLVYVSPLPPEQSGIAGHSAALLPALARHYDIDVVVHQDRLDDPWIEQHCRVRTVEWLRSHGRACTRVLYHFGNSHFHSHMFALLDEVPGVVVLHDFFLGGIVSALEAEAVRGHAWSCELYAAHGYPALRKRFHPTPGEPGVGEYPGSFGVLRAAQGVIVHSEWTRRLARQWYGDAVANAMQVVPLLRAQPPEIDRAAARQRLGLAADEVLVCAFGMLGPTKLNHRLLDVWLTSPLAADTGCRLVFVGERLNDAYGQALGERVSRDANGARVRFTGWISQAQLDDWLAAADIAVQLRSSERRELSAAYLDCLNRGVATIANGDLSAGEVPPDAVCMLPENFTDDALAQALVALRGDHRRRGVMAQKARDILSAHHRPAACAQGYAGAIERFHAGHPASITSVLATSIARQCGALSARDQMALALAITTNHPPLRHERQLLVDVSELVHRDARSGIQRVTRSILAQLLNTPPEGFRVEPVWAVLGGTGYRYARRFASQFLGLPEMGLEDDPIEQGEGDVFLGLDLQPHVVRAQRPALAAMRDRGVKTYFVVYDLLATLRPEYFVPQARQNMQDWLYTVTAADGAVCISRAVADDLRAWLDVFGGVRERPFPIGWFHLGADVGNSVPSRGMPPDATRVLAELRARPSLLMVGTIEPRKGHAQALAAVERLWAQGIDVNLVVVGSQGWQVEDVVDRMRAHRQRGRRLFWLEGTSDEYLEALYGACSALLAPSEAEGFGLPLIEGARKGLPLIARDIPVFREVAGAHAFYFVNRTDPELLAAALREWLALYRHGTHPRSKGLSCLDWADSARQLLQGPLHGQWHGEWMPDGVARYWGCDPRLYSQVGHVIGTGIQTTGQDGFLVYGPYLPFEAGHYQLRLRGEGRDLDGEGCWLDISRDRGEHALAKVLLPSADNLICMRVPFVLTQPVSDLEFRVRVDARARLRVDLIEVERLGAWTQ